jgi:hypothetical protein
VPFVDGAAKVPGRRCTSKTQSGARKTLKVRPMSVTTVDVDANGHGHPLEVPALDKERWNGG